MNSFIKGAPQSIVNKVGDYLASGITIINTLENPVFCNLISENAVGVNVEPENIETSKNAIEKLIENVSMSKTMGENAR